MAWTQWRTTRFESALTVRVRSLVEIVKQHSSFGCSATVQPRQSTEPAAAAPALASRSDL